MRSGKEGGGGGGGGGGGEGKEVGGEGRVIVVRQLSAV